MGRKYEEDDCEWDEVREVVREDGVGKGLGWEMGKERKWRW